MTGRRLAAALAGFVLAVAAAAGQPVRSAAGPLHAAFAAALAEQRPGPAVSRIGALSDYVPALAGTAMDSPVYFLDPAAPDLAATAPGNPATAPGSAKPGLPAILIVGGTHANEPAGVLAASLFISRARPTAARLIVIPRANASAATWPDPDRPGPEYIAVKGASGERRFRYGARLTAPAAQSVPDPDIFFPTGAIAGGGIGPGKKGLAGQESRNLNRSYPGEPAGTPTQAAAAAIIALIRAENVRAAFDLHEAGPSSGLAWDIIAHPKNIAHAAMGIMSAEDRGISMVLDRSSEEHRGLSHREWGEGTQAAAYLIETLNMGQSAGGLPGFDQLDDSKAPLWKRVGIQVEIILAILDSQAQAEPNPASSAGSVGSAGSAAWGEIRGMPGIEELRRDFSQWF